MNIKLGIIGIVFLLGLYFITYKNIEGFNGNISPRCPNLLIQKGNQFYLYNSNIAKVPGVNPVTFTNLEEYVEFTEWQRSQGILCPILFLQEAYDAQGNPVYKARPSPTNLQGGLPEEQLGTQTITKLFDAGRDDSPYNTNSFPGFDGQDQYVGLNTPLDQMYHETGSKVSPNPMDANWGGQTYTQKLVDMGYYENDE
jgi:hypothetical protein